MKSRKTGSTIVGALLLSFSLFFGEAAHADVIYSNFSVAALGNIAWSIAGESSPSGYQSVATGFTSAGNYSLDSISVVLDGTSGCSSFDCASNLLSVSLWTGAGNLLDAELGGWVINQPVNGVNTVSVSGVALISGSDYYLKLQTLGGPTASLGWTLNTQNLSTPVLLDHHPFLCFGCFPLVINAIGGAFELHGTVAVVPEPGSYALILVGLGIVGGIVRRKRYLESRQLSLR